MVRDVAQPVVRWTSASPASECATTYEGRNALAGLGSGGVGVSEPAPGESHWAVLTLLENVSDGPVDVLRVRVVGKSAALRVDRYAAFSRKEAGGVPLSLRAENGDALSDLSGKPVRVAPGQEGDVFYAARLTLTGAAPAAIRTCEVTYRHGGIEYEREFPCEFSMGED
jgi:hypothetical protein